MPAREMRTGELRDVRLAAIRFDHSCDVDAVLEAAVVAMRSRHRDIRGFVQREDEADDDCCKVTYLEDLVSGARHRISQPLGRGSRGCRLDPVAMAEICGPLLESLDRAPELIVINRFGKGEADGQGLRRVFEKAYLLKIPVLTAVREAHEDAWRQFTDGDADFLPPDVEAVLAWSEEVLGRKRRSLGELTADRLAGNG